jgi:hypothetical protein
MQSAVSHAISLAQSDQIRSHLEAWEWIQVSRACLRLGSVGVFFVVKLASQFSDEITVAWRIQLWLAEGWECRDRRLSRA